MLRILFIFILAITLTQTRKTNPKATITLTDENFDRLVQDAGNQRWYILFLEDWEDNAF